MSHLIADHLWQSTLIAVLAGLLALALRRNRAQVRYGLWLVASVKFLVPFAGLILIGRQFSWRAPAPAAQSAAAFVLDVMSQPFAPPALREVAAASTRAAAVSAADRLPALAVTVWLLGAVALLGSWLVRWRRVAIVARDAAPLTDGREVAILRRLEATAGSARPLAIVASNDSLEPGVFGIRNPVLLWPRAIGAHLSDAQVEGILAHELAHVRRRDNLAAALHMIVQAVCWFHPLVWWIGARLVEERERACDEAVLRLGSEPQVYAESILKTCELCLEAPLACVAGVTGADLKKRVMTIMRGVDAEALTYWRRALLAATAIGLIVVPLSAGVLSPPVRHAQAANESTGTVSAARFEVASIKTNHTGDKRLQLQIQPGGRFTATNVTMRMLIRNAYHLQNFQVLGGPDWISVDHFDIAAKAATSLPDPFTAKPGANPLTTMLRTLLEDRFKLVVHDESQNLPIYALVVARADGQLGPQLQRTTRDCAAASRGRGDAPRPATPSGQPPCGLQMGAGTITAGGATFAQLADVLSMPLGRVIVDKTDLTGAFDYRLSWTPDQPRATSAPGSSLEPPADPGGPSIFTAIQEQLGLKLESQRGPVNVIVIDRAGHPDEN